MSLDFWKAACLSGQKMVFPPNIFARFLLRNWNIFEIVKQLISWMFVLFLNLKNSILKERSIFLRLISGEDIESLIKKRNIMLSAAPVTVRLWPYKYCCKMVFI